MMQSMINTHMMMLLIEAGAEIVLSYGPPIIVPIFHINTIWIK